MVSVVAALCDLFVTLRTFVLLLFLEVMQGIAGERLPLGREERLEEPGIEHAATFAIIGHLYAVRLFEDFCHAEIHVGLALDLCVLW